MASTPFFLKARFVSPSQTVAQCVALRDKFTRYNIWIHCVSEASLKQRAADLESLSAAQRERLPLFGVPFAVKDNIDVAGLPTTAACPDFKYTARKSAPVVQRLLAAGAILIGKTNLDQFATGLVGVRSPYGVCHNAHDFAFVSGGSSSGSAVSVALDIVAFSLGTDTAGSGRVPAALNNIVGLKPTRGSLPLGGVVPACLSLDCVSIFARSVQGATEVLRVCQGYSEDDPFSRRPPPSHSDSLSLGYDELPKGLQTWGFRIGTPNARQLQFYGDKESQKQYDLALNSLEQLLGRAALRIDYQPFQDAANLLYEGPWVAERLSVVESFLKSGGKMLPVTRKIIENGSKYSAVDTFRAQYKLQELRRKSETVWEHIDFLVLPSIPTAYTIAEVLAKPVQLNSNLGFYTNFVNLLDLSALAIPAGFVANSKASSGKMPFGITLVAPAWKDGILARIGDAFGSSCIPQEAKSKM